MYGTTNENRLTIYILKYSINKPENIMNRMVRAYKKKKKDLLPIVKNTAYCTYCKQTITGNFVYT